MEADPPPPASALMEELVLRFPPADPASLVRVALVCKHWRRIFTGPRFRRGYRDLHLHAPDAAIEFDTLLPAGGISAFPEVVSVVDGVGVVFVRTAGGLFTIDLKSLQATMVSMDTAFSSIFPYISFHTPALEAASTGEGPSSGA